VPKNALPVPQPVFQEIRIMDENREKLAVETFPIPACRPNRGSFQPGDPRINRQGRPRGKKVRVAEGAPLPVLAEQTDRLMCFFVKSRVLISCLTQMKAPWMRLPFGIQFVGCRVDPIRKGLVFVIRSDTFDRVARGTPIPEFTPFVGGLVHCRLPDV
jgi:hypothetical protein